MAKLDINTGSAANDGTGDQLRTAFGKANTNFTELYTNQNLIQESIDSNYSRLSALDSNFSALDSNFSALSTYITTDYIATPGIEIPHAGEGSWIPMLTSAGTGNNLLFGQGVKDPYSIGTVDGQNTISIGPDMKSDQSGWMNMYIGGDLVLTSQSPDISVIPTQIGYNHDVRRIKGLWVDTIDVDNITMGGSGQVYAGVDTNVEIKGSVSFAAVPASSIGAVGDKVGLMAIDGSHVYYCGGAYDGVADIWVRTPWAETSW
jgi:hypothetical protein